MKALATRIMILAAGAVAATSMAYGQNRMTAEIPFDFRLSNITLPAGSYSFDRLMGRSGTNEIRVSDGTTRHTVYSLPLDGFRKAEKPTAVFVCTDAGCSLSELRTGEGTYVYPAQKSKEAAGTTKVHVPLKGSNGD